jgi:hypothetical protein
MLAGLRHVACIGEIRNTYRILVGKSEGKRPLQRPSLGYEDNVKLAFREILGLY